MRARHGIAYLTLVAQKDAQAASRHPNGVQRIERVYIAVKDVRPHDRHRAQMHLHPV